MSLKIKLERVDNRLLHSTIALTWSRFLNANYFVIVDENEHINDFYYSILRLGIPDGKELKIVTSKQVKSFLQRLSDSEKTYKVILIFKSFYTLVKSLDAGIKCKEVQVPYDRSRFTMSHFQEQFSKDEIKYVKECQKKRSVFLLSDNSL